MRINLILMLLITSLLAVSALLLSGFWWVLSILIILIFSIISMFYPDAALLYFLGARSLKRDDEAKFHLASAQEAYKLAVAVPKLYFYNGSFDRAFIVEGRGEASLVISKELLENCDAHELEAICFSLLLQLKKDVVKKRTKTIFLIGFFFWLSSSVIDILGGLIPIKHFKTALLWLGTFMIKPWTEILFKVSIGEHYFQRFKKYLTEFPREADLLFKIEGKILRPRELDSFSLKKILEFSALSKNAHYQRIMAIEVLPHEWDYIFNSESGSSVK